MHLSPRGEIYTFSPWGETFCIFYYEKHSFHPGLDLIFCLNVKDSLFPPCPYGRGEISPRLLRVNNKRDFLRDRSEFTPRRISHRGEIMHVNYS